MPNAVKWRVSPIKHYKLMEELWATDCAIGGGVQTHIKQDVRGNNKDWRWILTIKWNTFQMNLCLKVVLTQLHLHRRWWMSIALTWLMSPSSRIRKPRRSHAELMKLPWRRMKVRKLEDERRSGAAMVFREALKWGWANTQGRGLYETKKENSSLSWFTKREESRVISIEFLYYIHEWKYKGPKLSIYRLNETKESSKSGGKKESRKLNFRAKKEHVGRVTCHLSKSHLSCHGKLTLFLGE